jgi:hypothetical protein
MPGGRQHQSAHGPGDHYLRGNWQSAALESQEREGIKSLYDAYRRIALGTMKPDMFSTRKETL